MSEYIEVWAEEPDTRVRAEPWKGGAILTITSPWALQPIVVTVAAYRWERIVAALANDAAGVAREAITAKENPDG